MNQIKDYNKMKNKTFLPTWFWVGIFLTAVFVAVTSTIMLGKQTEENFKLIELNNNSLLLLEENVGEYESLLEGYKALSAECMRLDGKYEPPVDIQQPLPFTKG